MSVKVKWWDASLAFWTLAEVTTRFIKSLHFLNIIFAKLPEENQLAPVNLIFFYISSLKSLNLALIPGAKLDAYRCTWTGCSNQTKLCAGQPFSIYQQTLSNAIVHRTRFHNKYLKIKTDGSKRKNVYKTKKLMCFTTQKIKESILQDSRCKEYYSQQNFLENSKTFFIR